MRGDPGVGSPGSGRQGQGTDCWGPRAQARSLITKECEKCEPTNFQCILTWPKFFERNF